MPSSGVVPRNGIFACLLACEEEVDDYPSGFGDGNENSSVVRDMLFFPCSLPVGKQPHRIMPETIPALLSG